MPEPPPSRPFLTGLAALAAAGAGVLAVRTFLQEPVSVEVTHQDLPVPDLPPNWEGRTLLQLTDLHYGDPRSEYLFRFCRRVVEELQPDLLVFTGDFVLHTIRQGRKAARHLSRMQGARATLGVLGDHDYCGNCDAPIHGLPELLEEAGVRLLRNSSVELDGGLRVAGVDPHTVKIRKSDLPAALFGAPPPHLLLSHSPDLAPQAAEAGVPVMLCGHSHGGQIVVPGFGPPVTHLRMPREFASGWARYGPTQVYTCRGVASHLSMRFCCPPEIACFRLVRVGTANP